MKHCAEYGREHGSKAGSTFVAALLGTVLLVAVQAAGAGQPTIDIQRAARGDDAIAALGGRLPEVAHWYNAEAGDLSALLKHDISLWADRHGKLFYQCAMHDDSQTDPVAFSIPGSITSTVFSAPFPLSQTFLLHSRPGSSRVIYLDCNGETLTGTEWNNYFGMSSISLAPLDTDGNTASFSSNELAIVQQAWQRVAEDYATFDVDVTTEDPGANALTRSSLSDMQYGVKAVLTSTSLDGSAGRAYVGAFDEVGDSHKPALIFSASRNDPQAIAETASHEVGHTLGLYHDGTTNGVEYYAGQGNWAPIMGGSVGKEVTQWSKGEYPGANNLQDDLFVIQSHGLACIADDHGDSLATATVLSGSSISAAGSIGQNGDWDVFKFDTGAGTISLMVNAAPLGADLDIATLLLDASGALVYSSSPTNALGATMAVTVPAGTYYLAVFGVGTGDPLTGYSDYASIGKYTIAGQLVAVSNANVAPTAVITLTPGTGVAPLPVSFSSAGSSDPDGTIAGYAWDFGDGTTSTAANPSHTYSVAGTYSVRLTVRDNVGATSSASATVVVSANTAAVLHVGSIDMALVVTSKKKYVTASVLVVDGSGKPISGATVAGLWGGTISGTASGTTGADGRIILASPSLRKSGTVTFSVTAVTLAGYTYNSSLNVESLDAITAP